MRPFVIFFLVFFSCYCLSSCHTDNSKVSAVTKTDDSSALDKQWARTFIDSVNNKFSQEVASGDSVGLASNYWPDAELLLDNSDVVKGKDIQASWSAFIQMGVKQMNFTTTDIAGTSSFIIETGNYEIKGGQNKLLDRGKYVVVWEKRMGEWKLYRDIGNTSLPSAK